MTKPAPSENEHSSGYILDAGYAELEARPELNSHLAALAVRSLSRNPFKKLIVDLSGERKELSGGMLLAVALTMAEKWREEIPEERVGVVFPAGLGGILTNLALSLLGKVPVNLNFSLGAASIKASMEKAGIERVITAKPVIQKLTEFPWPSQVIDLIKERSYLSKKDILKKFALLTVLPTDKIIKRYGIPTEGGNREAGLLFSSGSTGNPKGIPLTHSNVIANCLQIEKCRLLNNKQVLLACLPTFHSFGFTATLWYPLITGLRCVTVPSPLETRRIAEAIEAEKVTILMGTPTFLRPYFQRVRVEQLKTLKAVVAGAEKTPPGFGERWEKHFGSAYLEGYGLTETSPVVAVNLPEMDGYPAFKKKLSVGPLLWGMQARTVNSATGEPLGMNERGILELRGANVFHGYLKDRAENEKAFHDGWFVTGDLARIDKDGYLFIEGRISRFSKLGGEMVPHGQLEQIIAECFGLQDAEEPLVAVTGIEDEKKGEALVLLSAVEIKLDLLRERLTARGVPNLWIPRVIKRVDAIPCLASGKLDLASLNRLAEK